MNAVSRARSVSVAALFGLLTAVTATSARAEDAESDADSLFRAGREAMKAGDYDKACSSFARSQKLEPTTGTTLNLAICLEKQGRTADARREVQAVLDDPRVDDRRRVIALRLSAELDARESAAQRVVDTPKESTPAAQPTKAMPSRVVAGDGSARQAWRRTLPTESGPRHDGTMQTIGAYSLGVGVASLVTSAVFGYMALDAKATVDARCKEGSCYPEGMDAAKRVMTFGNVATVALALGVVATGSGVVLLLVTPNSASGRPAGAMPNVVLGYRSRF